MLRNRGVLVTALTLPVAAIVCVTWFAGDSPGTRHGAVAALVVFAVAGWGMYAGTVVLLRVSRRDRCSGRPRSVGADHASIVLGTLLAVTAVTAAQVSLTLVVLGAVAGPPRVPGTFAAATFLALSLTTTMGLATAAVVRSPARALTATLLIAAGVMSVASWIAVSGAGELAGHHRLLPGGGAAELVVAAWDGSVVAADVPLLVGPTLGWVVASACVGSTRAARRSRASERVGTAP